MDIGSNIFILDTYLTSLMAKMTVNDLGYLSLHFKSLINQMLRPSVRTCYNAQILLALCVEEQKGCCLGIPKGS